MGTKQVKLAGPEKGLRQIDVVGRGAMGEADTARVVGLLTRWASRKLQRQGKPQPGDPGEIVTVDVSKGSGDKKGEN